MPPTWRTENTRLASRYSGKRRGQSSQCNGNRRVNHTTSGNRASISKALLDSQTTGSQAGKSGLRRRISIRATSELAAVLAA